MHIVFAHTLIWNCRYHRHLHPSFTLNSTTATHSTSVFPAFNLNVYNVLHAPSSKLLTSHSPPLYILKSLHWLKVNERIEYKLISVTYKVLTTSQPTYLSDLISVQPPHLYSYFNCRHFSSLCPSVSSSLKITNRFFCYPSHHLWNQRPHLLRQPHQMTPSLSQ